MAVILITGCRRATGFGQLTAMTFAKNGHTVYATMREANQGKALLDEAKHLNLDMRVLSHDVTSAESNKNVVSTIIEEQGQIDVLVNNAGIGAFGAVETIRAETLRSVMETNFFGGVDLARAVLPGLRQQGKGNIIFVTSLAGRFGLPGEGAYSASKFAMEGLAEALSYEVRRFGIDVSIIEPGFFNTGMSSANTSSEEQYIRSKNYDSFNAHIVASTEQGEDSGEDPQLVADMILEITRTTHPKLRWQPGKAGPVIVKGWMQSTDEQWQAGMIDDMQLGWWIKGEQHSA